MKNLLKVNYYVLESKHKLKYINDLIPNNSNREEAKINDYLADSYKDLIKF